VQQAATLGVVLDQVLICCGGGGLTAGSALAIHELSPATKIYTVEPVGFDDTRRSLERDERVGIEGNPESVCDALLTPMPGELTFAINRRLVDRGLVVSDEEAARAVAFAFREFKVVLEPSGAVSLAALLSGKLDARGQTIGVIASGGNVDSERFAECLVRQREG
jgi:threonine dehydratase